MKDPKNLLLMVLCIVCIAGISCGGFIDRLTPCEVTEQSMSYAERKMPPLGVMTLHEAKQIQERIKIKHRVSQLSLKRLAEDDKTSHDDAIGFIVANITASESFQDIVVGSAENPMSIMGLLGIGGLGLLGGRMQKRRGDLAPAEVEEVVAKAKVAAVKEVV